MKGKKGILFYCVICNRICDSLHEIIFGRGNRDVCIKYNIQAPLCAVCNSSAIAHGPDAMTYRHFLLVEFLQVDPARVVAEVRDPHSKREYLAEIKDHCKRQILKYEK